VATWGDVRRIALALPETDEQVSRNVASWRVRKKGFVGERPLGQADVRALGDNVPTGPILGVHVEHLGAKEALLADDPAVCARLNSGYALLKPPWREGTSVSTTVLSDSSHSHVVPSRKDDGGHAMTRIRTSSSMANLARG
jgi:hypothetical protein